MIERPNELSSSSERRTNKVTGVEWVIDAIDCDAKRLQNLELILGLCDHVIADLALKVIGKPQSHQFDDPQGVTALYLLSESHLACHTYPEHGIATFNLYCCRERMAWDWSTQLTTRLGAGAVVTKRIVRGAPDPLDHQGTAAEIEDDASDASEADA